MSSNNFISIERNYEGLKGDWEVWFRDADTGAGHIAKTFNDELEAFRWAVKNDDTEYGIQHATPPKKRGSK